MIYFSAAHLLYSPADYPASYELSYDQQQIECITKDDEQLRYISFLDPSTLEVYLNKGMITMMLSQLVCVSGGIKGNTIPVHDDITVVDVW